MWLMSLPLKHLILGLGNISLMQVSTQGDKMKKLLLIILIILFSTSPVWADRYYCFSADAQGHAVGDDSNTGYGAAGCTTDSHWYKTIEAMNYITENLGTPTEDIYLLLEEGDTWNWSDADKTDFHSTEVSATVEDYVYVNQSGTASYRIIYGAADSSGNLITGSDVSPQPTLDWDLDTWSTAECSPSQKMQPECLRPECPCIDSDTPEAAYRWTTCASGFDGSDSQDYYTLQDWHITKINSYALQIDDKGSGVPDDVRVLRNTFSWIGNNGLVIEDCMDCNINGNTVYEANLVSGECEILKGAAGFLGCAYPANPCGRNNTCKETGGAAININEGCYRTEAKNNTVYNVYGECFGSYFASNVNQHNLFQGNIAWNCMSAPYHATSNNAIYRWNFSGYYDPGGGGEQHWFNGTWPNCVGTGKSGHYPVYDGQAASEYALIGNVMFGQNDTSSYGSGPSSPWQNVSNTPFNIWWRNNTAVDAWRNFILRENLVEDNEISSQYFNISVFYDSEVGTGMYHCSISDNYNNNDTNYNFWESTISPVILDGDCSGGGDMSGNPQLQEQDGSDYIFPENMTTITWKSFRPLSSSPLIDPAQSAYTTTVDTSDTCGGASCGSIILLDNSSAMFFVGDYITVADPASMAAYRTNTTYVTAVNRTTDTLTLNASITIDDSWYVILNPFIWEDKAQDTTTGWYDLATQNHTQPILLSLTRNILTGVSDAHDWTDWVVCTNNASIATCLASTVWTSYDDTTNKTSIEIPANVLLEDTTYYWTARTHNAWPYEGDWQSLDEFETVDVYVSFK
jgi:hypothetical protein